MSVHVQKQICLYIWRVVTYRGDFLGKSAREELAVFMGESGPLNYSQ